MNEKRNRNDIKRGDIFYISNIASVDCEQSGDRPSVIVSNDIGNAYAPIVEVVFLTTKKSTLPTHVHIKSSKRPSIVLCEQITTVSKNRLGKRIGRVSYSEMKKIDKALAISLEIYKENILNEGTNQKHGY